MALVRDFKVETAAELALDDGHVTEGIRKEPHTQRLSGPVFLRVGTIQFCDPHGS